MGQSPCYVIEDLTLQCTGQQLPLTALSPGEAYVAPQYYGPSPISCYCSSVYYSLISACAFCQNGSWIPWANYLELCNQTYLMEYPGPIPSDTSVPSWAYLNLTETGYTFDPAVASYLATASSSSMSSASFNSTSESGSSSSTPKSISNSTSGASKTGTIAGGTIGGLVMWLLLGTFLSSSANRIFNIYATNVFALYSGPHFCFHCFTRDADPKTIGC
ncbi:hypothetical protein F5887DRAFT_981026 [Amanita rubescens]|nr:hypothetical protein F5887DRAFT_981026 [Amanita rubescens]